MGIWEEIKTMIQDAIDSDPDYRRQQKLREAKKNKKNKKDVTTTDQYVRKNLEIADEFNIEEK